MGIKWYLCLSLLLPKVTTGLTENLESFGVRETVEAVVKTW